MALYFSPLCIYYFALYIYFSYATMRRLDVTCCSRHVNYNRGTHTGLLTDSKMLSSQSTCLSCISLIIFSYNNIAIQQCCFNIKAYIVTQYIQSLYSWLLRCYTTPSCKVHNPSMRLPGHVLASGDRDLNPKILSAELT